MTEERHFLSLHKVISNISIDDRRETVTADLVFPPDFPAFDGHFPGQPVLPAVIQLAVVRGLVADLLGRSLEPVSTERLKFKGMVGPDQPVSVTVEVSRSGEDWLSNFRFSHADGPVSSGAVIYRERPQ